MSPSRPSADLPRPLSKADMVGVVLFLAIGAAIAAGAVVAAVLRFAEVVRNRSVSVLAEFHDTVVQVPIGPDGALREITLERATFVADQLRPPALAFALAQPAVGAIGVVAIVGCLSWVSVNLLRRQVFSRTNTVLICTAGISALILWPLDAFLGSVVANDAFAVISGGQFTLSGTIPVGTLFLTGYAIAIACTAFTVGNSLRRETEGLV